MPKILTEQELQEIRKIHEALDPKQAWGSVTADRMIQQHIPNLLATVEHQARMIDTAIAYIVNLQLGATYTELDFDEWKKTINEQINKGGF